MSWTLNASGTSPTEEEERLLVSRLRSMLRNPRLGMASGTLSTDHFGTIDLTANLDPTQSASGQAPRTQAG